LYIVVFYIALFIGVLPLFFLFVKKRAFDKSHPVVPFLWLTAIASFYEFFGSVLLKINTSYWFQLYPFLSFLLLYYFFFNLLKPDYKYLFRVFFILFIIVYGISFYFWSDNDRFVSSAINRSSITIFVFTFASLWFKNVFEKMDIPNLWQNDMFYFIVGLTFYYSSTIFLFLSSIFILNSNLYFYDFWLVNVIATLVLRILLCLGVWKMKQG
jgi:hypothetical protein